MPPTAKGSRRDFARIWVHSMNKNAQIPASRYLPVCAVPLSFSCGHRSKYGTPSKTVINKAANGTKAWVTSLTGNYKNNELSYLYSPCFDLSGLTQPVLSFSHILIQNRIMIITGLIIQQTAGLPGKSSQQAPGLQTGTTIFLYSAGMYLKQNGMLQA